MIRTLCLANIAAALVLGIEIHAGPPSEIGLYPPDLRAIRRLIGPAETPTLPPGDQYSRIAKAWSQVSKKGREFLLREPDVALVVVAANGKWSYRSTGMTALRYLYSSRESLRAKDAENLSDVFESTWGRELRDFYQAVLFGTGPYSTAGSRGVPTAVPYGLMLSRAKQPDVGKQEKEWFLSLVGSEITALDNDTREAVTGDPTYGREIRDAVATIAETRKRQLDAVARAFATGASHRISVADLALPMFSLEAARVSRPWTIAIIGENKVYVWSIAYAVIFVIPKYNDPNLPSELTKESLRSLIESGKVKAFASSPLSEEVFEVAAASPAKRCSDC
jgi:hypothetical protein